jgi:hypothetical protein
MRCLDRENAEDFHEALISQAVHAARPGTEAADERCQAALRRRELVAQLQVPQVQRIALQSLQTVKSTEPK